MRRVIKAKWRPTLLMVIAGVLASVLALPFLGLIIFRLINSSLGSGASYVVVALGMLSLTAILGLALRRVLLRPITELSLRAQDLSHAKQVEPLAQYGTRELRDLGQVVLDMGDALQNREASIRAYSDHITHELKSPLTAVLGAAEMLKDDGNAQDQRLIATVRDSARRMERLLESLRSFAAASETHYAGETQLHRVLGALRTEFDSVDMQGSDFKIALNAEGLEIVLRHLIANSVDHGADEVLIELTPTGFLVKDNGRGLSSDITHQVFEPFFTTRRETGGTGMGLSIVARVLGTVAGEIRIRPQQNGACFEVVLR